MKKAFTFILAVLLTTIIFAQSPEKISYQAVVRNSNNVLVANKQIGMQICILQGSPSGTVIYVETQTPTTNANGLVSLEIGSGTVVLGNFSSIDWANGTYFIRTETDPEGGASYTITGTIQLLSVPYALHAKTAEAVTGEITETDPVFSAWDKSEGISITESQISDLGTYIENETDPVFTAWDKSTGISITESQVVDLGDYIEAETDPVFTAWDKSTGISITESQISDLGNYIETETDPAFTAWDKSTGILITESQISDLGNYIETETDPAFTAWDKSTGISITESQISNLGNYIETETDPVFDAWDKSTGISITESQISDLGNYITTETDPVFTAWDKSTGISITESQISDLGNYIEIETDPTGMQQGDMLYWNGTEWVTIAATQYEGATLQMIGGVPTWTGGTPPNVANPATGKIWLDRNLGASRVATSSTDADSYGDLYQWGRGSDGHQLRTSATTTTLSDSDSPGHAYFILASFQPFDWRSPQNDSLWQGVNGVNNPCPSGYRLPTKAEWQAELDTWGSSNPAGAFASPLKLPLAGRRLKDGSFNNVDFGGYYWSSTLDDTWSWHLDFGFGTAKMWSSSHVNAFSVRCIKN